MYETDRLPDSWVSRISVMDEVWVPSHFAVEQFASSGIPRGKIFVVPEAVDTYFFDPSKHEPLDLTLEKKPALFRFLSVFKWEKRKGWDLLLRAYFEEFTYDDPVILIIKTQSFHSGDDFDKKVKKALADATSFAASGSKPARYKLFAEDLDLAELPRLYRAADAFVLPSRGEGWGRPHVEAMSMGLPIIATNWGGSMEFLSENCSLPLKIDGLEEVEEGQGPKGHKWAVPSMSHLRKLMRWTASNQDQAEALGKAARHEMVTRFSPQAIVEGYVLPRLRHALKMSQTRHREDEL
eukprot:TRINITY_DN7945_c0_g1_i1.p1 TRINITY_DN7945_c0_g1~~TRINITY_DN7945_c0_g1_i1.p1  ORF type:complete len:341 (+),score=54.94 TRINITY_DN7945_c0_g1_i1:140-1024(+)